jgi:hypothetical protein
LPRTLTTAAVTKAGRAALAGSATAAASEGYLYVAVTDDALRDGKARSLAITIECFDEGTGIIGVQYDSDDQTVCINKEPVGAFKSANSIELEDTKAWQTATIVIMGAQGGGTVKVRPGNYRIQTQSVQRPGLSGSSTRSAAGWRSPIVCS